KNIFIKLVEFLQKVIQHSSENKMDISNLATCLAPNILRPKNDALMFVEDFKKISRVFIFLFENFDVLFGRVSENASKMDQILPDKFQRHLSTGAVRIASLMLKQQEEALVNGAKNDG